MKLVLIVVILMLNGCAYQTTSAGDIQEAINICKEHGGINHIDVFAVSSEWVVCQDELHTELHIGK